MIVAYHMDVRNKNDIEFDVLGIARGSTHTQVVENIIADVKRYYADHVVVRYFTFEEEECKELGFHNSDHIDDLLDSAIAKHNDEVENAAG
jgi:hypothetical protein